MRTVNRRDFQRILNRLDVRNKEYVLRKKRGTITLTGEGLGNIVSVPQFKNREDFKYLLPKERRIAMNVFTQVAKSFNRYLLKNELKVTKIKLLHKQLKLNKKNWNRLKIGESVFYIDVDNCYWSVAHSLGYISKRLYLKFRDEKKYKTFRNMSLASQTSEITAEYKKAGVTVRKVKEVKNLQKIMYNNIRFLSYNLMGTLYNSIEKEAISYRTDGIMVTRNAVIECMQFFEDIGMEVKVVQYRKANDVEIVNMDSGDIKKI